MWNNGKSSERRLTVGARLTRWFVLISRYYCVGNSLGRTLEGASGGAGPSDLKAEANLGLAFFLLLALALY